MSYVNVGAYVNGARPKSKKALREALRDTPEAVEFDVTDLVGPRAGEHLGATPDDLGMDYLQVVGPDPHTKRNWYATVTVNGTGATTHLYLK